jgi:serine/threonine protein kinase
MDIPGYKLLEESKEERKTSCTYNALNIQTGKTVLVRVFNKELSTNSIFRTHFRSVTRILRSEPLGSNVRIIDSIIHDDACILIAEHRDYYSLNAKNNVELSNTETLEIGRQLASCLSLLHKQNIVHGGVQLSNISISENKEVVLGPAELQKTMPSENPLKLAVDKVEDIIYRAPEANAGLTASTDFYALGVLMYELFVGKKPFETESISLLEKSKEKGSYFPLNSKHRYLAPLFKKMLSPNPKMRVSNIYEFEFILSQCEELSARQDIGFDPEFGFIAGKEVADPSPLTHRKMGASRSILVGLSIAGVLGLLYLFTNNILKKDDITPDVAQSAPEVIQPIEGKIKQTSPKPTETPQSNEKQIEPNSLLASVDSLIKENDFEAALKTINNASSTESTNEDIVKIKSKIEDELKIRSLIATAETQFKNSNLLSPPNNNAFETYQTIIPLSLEDDNRAIKGLTKIADHFMDRSINLKEQQQYEKAKETIELGLKAKPDHRKLLALKASLIDTAPVTNDQPNALVSAETEIETPKDNQSTEDQPRETGALPLTNNQPDASISAETEIETPTENQSTEDQPRETGALPLTNNQPDASISAETEIETPTENQSTESQPQETDTLPLTENQPNALVWAEPEIKTPTENQNTESQPPEINTLEKSTDDTKTDKQSSPLNSVETEIEPQDQQKEEQSQEEIIARVDNTNPASDGKPALESEKNKEATKTESQSNPKQTWNNNIKEITRPKGPQPIINDKLFIDNSEYSTNDTIKPYEATPDNLKIALVEKELFSSKLSVSSLETATSKYKSLRADSHDNERISKLHEKILNSYVALAKTKEKSKQLSDALITANKGLELKNDHQELLAIRNRVQQSLNRIEKWDEAGPIIGTF